MSRFSISENPCDNLTDPGSLDTIPIYSENYFQHQLNNLNKKGSVTRTVHDKLKEFVSVKDFGAVGDGNADDSDAIQSAINSFLENSYMSVWGDGKLYTNFQEMN